MEGRLKQTSQTPFGDTFDALCPHYVAMGMPYDLYWDGEYGSKTAYREAYKLKLETEQRMADQSNWYMGQYIIAVLHAVPLLVAGLNTKGSNLPSYPDKPILEKQAEEKKTKNAEEERRKQEEDQTKLAMSVFQSAIAKINQNIVKRLEREKAQKAISGQ